MKKRSRYSPRARQYVAQKIRRLAREGYPAPRRVAQALSMARQRGLKVPRKPNPAEHREPARDHIRNAMALLMTTQPYTEDGEPLTKLDVQMILTRLRKALNEIERVDIALSNRRRSGNVRRGNPSLMVLGANPRVEDATLASWAKIEYIRPDDPDGDDVIRVHEFRDGFEIGWLSDGSVQLSHPRHRLWTEDEIGRA